MILYEKGSTTAEASGTTFTLQDTSNERKLSFKKYYGNTTQEGTPTPSSPQPINVVTGGNTISVVGKNLFDITKYDWFNAISKTNMSIDISNNVMTLEAIGTTGAQASMYTIFGLDSSKNYYFSWKGKKVVKTTDNGSRIRVKTFGSNNNGISWTDLGNVGNDTITQGQEYSYYKQLNGYSSYRMYFYNDTNTPVTIGEKTQYYDIQIEEGTSKTNYEEYKGKEYEINLGKNLFQNVATSTTLNDVTFTINEDKSISLSGTSSGSITFQIGTFKGENGKTYCLSGCSNGSNSTYYLNLQGVTNQINTPVTFNGDGNTHNLRIYIASGKDVTGVIIKPQVELGKYATSYSPYKTPIELNKINTYQDTIFKSSGKNLWNIENQVLLRYISYDSSTGVYSASDNDNRSSLIYKLQQYNGDSSISGTTTSVTISATGKYVLTTTIVSNCNRLRFANNGQTKEFSLLLNNIQDLGIKVGDTITLGVNVIDTTIGASKFNEVMLVKGTYTSQNLPPYEPYGKDWYIKKEIGKVVLDGSETGWGITNSGTANWYYRLSYTTNIVSGTGLSSLCNYYPLVEIGNNNTTQGLGIVGAYFRIRWGTEDTITNFKTWLNTHNVIIYYPINTPTYTKITDEELLGQIEALENATTYDNVTNILQSNTDLPLYVDIEYLKPLDFSRNGLGYLPNVLNAYVTDEINGEYSLTFEYPIEDRMASEIVEDRIVKCKVADGSNQCFIIKKIQKNFDKMSVYCTHLFYMLYDDFLEDTYPQNLSPKPFLDHILSRANYQLPFVANSDIATSKTARYVRKNVVETILGNINNSMYNLWGLELKRDNWNIGLKARLGADKGEKLIFGKNITGVDVSVDTTGIYTRIMPIGFDGLLLPEKYIDAPNINEYPYPRICLYEFSNIRYDADLEDTEAYHTLDEAYQALRDAVQELFDKGINKPKINIKVDWLELSKTEEFKQYSALERVDLGDTLTSNLFGMDYETRVIKTIYNPLNDRIEQFEIGTFKPSITTEMNQLNFDVVNLPSSMLDEAQANATQLITQAMGGYVYKTNSELYIMDNPDPAQAVKVWRWNINGLGYSSTGINGTYGIAMTMDGSIVADFITTGQLSANVISASTIIGVINGNTSQLKLDADQIDLTATDVLNILAGNSLNLTSKNITIDSTNFSVDSGGNMTCSNANITGGYLELTDNPDTYDDRLIIKKKNSTELTTLTSEYVLTKKAQSDDYNYSQMSLDSGLAHGVGTDSNNFKTSEMNQDSITLTKRENGTTTRSQYRSDGATINGDIYNNALDLFNDTSGNTWQEMMKNKIDYCIANINTSKTYAMAFINGGWQGVDFGFGIYSKIGTMNQLVFYTFSNIYHCRYDSLTGNYAYYQYI